MYHRFVFLSRSKLFIPASVSDFELIRADTTVEDSSVNNNVNLVLQDAFGPFSGHFTIAICSRCKNVNMKN